jgi:heme-degrading monooxygenase HmoA
MNRSGQVAVIFVSERTGIDPDGYAAAAAAMDALAAAQPGYRGMDHEGGAERGITVSYWADEASALAWRHHPDHVAVRQAGRGRWYRRYALHVAAVTRSYGWARDDAP